MWALSLFSTTLWNVSKNCRAFVKTLLENALKFLDWMWLGKGDEYEAQTANKLLTMETLHVHLKTSDTTFLCYIIKHISRFLPSFNSVSVSHLDCKDKNENDHSKPSYYSRFTFLNIIITKHTVGDQSQVKTWGLSNSHANMSLGDPVCTVQAAYKVTLVTSLHLCTHVTLM